MPTIYFLFGLTGNSLNMFMGELNQFLPMKKVDFLDVSVSLKNVMILTDLYTESTDCYQISPLHS